MSTEAPTATSERAPLSSAPSSAVGRLLLRVARGISSARHHLQSHASRIPVTPLGSRPPGGPGSALCRLPRARDQPSASNGPPGGPSAPVAHPVHSPPSDSRSEELRSDSGGRRVRGERGASALTPWRGSALHRRSDSKQPLRDSSRTEVWTFRPPGTWWATGVTRGYRLLSSDPGDLLVLNSGLMISVDQTVDGLKVGLGVSFSRV